MAQATPLINNFNGGELSPYLDVRSDVGKYGSGCSIMEGFMPLIEGGAKRIPGTYFVTEVKHSAKITRLIPFSFSTTQTYVLEFGDLYIRFYKGLGQIYVDYAAWVTTTNYVLGNLVTQGAGYYRCLIAHAAGVFADDLAAGKWEASGGATDVAYEIPTTYLEAELFTLKFVQSADTLFIVHPGHPPAKLTRTAHTTWTLGNMSLTANPFGAGNYPGAVAFYEQRLIFGGTDANPQTIWASVSADYYDFTVTPAADDSSYEYTIASDRVDRIYWLLGVSALLIGTIGGIWRVSSSNGTDPITPTNVTVKKQDGPGSRNIDPEPVDGGVLWVSYMGTTIKKQLYDYAVDKWITLDMNRISKHITYGTDDDGTGIVDIDFQREPIPVFWGVRADGQMMLMTYESQEEVFAWFRHKAAADGVFKSVAIIAEEQAEDVVWTIVERIIDTETVQYIEYFMPQNFYSTIEDCFFVQCGLSYDGGDAVDIEGITNADPAVVTSTAHPFSNGDEVRIKAVEGMTEVNVGLQKAYTVANKAANTFQLSGIDSTDWGEYTEGGTAQKVTSSPSDLEHLEGEEVMVLVDGAVYSPNPTVASGTFTMTIYGNKIHAGLHQRAILAPMKTTLTMPDGTTRGRKQKITKLTVSFYETVGGKAGPNLDELKSIPFGTGGSPSLYSGDYDQELGGNWGNENNIVIVQDQPLPMTVMALIPRLSVEDA